MKHTSRILVVSDNKEAVRRDYLQSLDSVFRNVEFVRDENCAMAAMEQQPFDVVLLDSRKADANGLAVLRSMKQRWPQSEVVIIAGAATIAKAKEAIRLGAYDYVAKPISPQKVVDLATCALTKKAWTIHRVSDLASISECCPPNSRPVHRLAGNNGAKNFRRREKS